MTIEKRVMVNQDKGHADVDEDNERRHARSQAKRYQYRADGIGDQRINQTGVGAKVHRIGKMSRHLREMGEFFQAMLPKQVDAESDA